MLIKENDNNVYVVLNIFLEQRNANANEQDYIMNKCGCCHCCSTRHYVYTV